MDVDELFDGNQTIMRPRPGGGINKNNVQQTPQVDPAINPKANEYTTAPIPPATTTPSLNIKDTNNGLPVASSLNPLLHTAANLLSFIHVVRNTADYPNPTELFDQIVEEIQAFQQKAMQTGYDRYDVTIASELLCCFIDETIRAMPWSTTSSWATRSLLNQLHQGSKGGEHFFVIAQRLMDYSKQKRDLLELAYILLSLGFQGRYRLAENGQQSLQSIRNQLYSHIEQHRGKPETALSINWRGAAKPQQQLTRMLPLWVCIAAASCLLLIIYTFFLFSLNRASDPVAIKMVSLGRDIPIFKGVPIQQPQPVLPRLAELLSAEIAENVLSVEYQGDYEVVTLSGDRFFLSGSGTVKEDSIFIINSIAEALQQLPGQIIISGHTDNVPIQTLRFPSNWHLSKARAMSVAEALQISTERITVEARGEAEPKFDNNSSTNRALNRRVEIMLIVNRN